jgi:hypothetical protein
MVRQILESTAIRVTTACTVVTLFVGLAWGVAVWATNVSRDLHEIRSQLDLLGGQVDDRWRRGDMRHWAQVTAQLNSGWTPAEVPAVP